MLQRILQDQVGAGRIVVKGYAMQVCIFSHWCVQPFRNCGTMRGSIGQGKTQQSRPPSGSSRLGVDSCNHRRVPPDAGNLA